MISPFMFFILFVRGILAQTQKTQSLEELNILHLIFFLSKQDVSFPSIKIFVLQYPYLPCNNPVICYSSPIQRSIVPSIVLESSTVFYQIHQTFFMTTMSLSSISLHQETVAKLFYIVHWQLVYQLIVLLQKLNPLSSCQNCFPNSTFSNFSN